jgi:hypothetical protein
MAVRPDFLNESAPAASTEKVEKESNEARFCRIADAITPLSCEVSKPSGGKGHQSHFVRIKHGDEEMMTFNLGVIDTSGHGLAHNRREAALLRKMAAALIEAADNTDSIIDLTLAHLKAQAERKAKQIREKYEAASTPAAKREVIKAFGLHGPDLESVPNGKRFDDAVAEMLQKMVTFEK